MKRQLSLVLALVMILGSFSAVFAAEMPTTPQTKAEFLQDKKILKGNLEGELNLAQDLKRRDALVVLSRLFGKEDEAKATSAEDLVFTDITDPHYNGYIAWAVAEGYAKGKTETTFDLNGPLTAQHFSTFLLRALGYEVDAKADYDKALETAKELGLLADLELEAKDTVTRGDMAAMTFNALGVVVKGGTKTLAETLNIKLPAPTELKVEEVRTENLIEVVVELSNAKLADEEKLEDANNYKLAGFTVEKATLEENVVTLLLNKALVKDRKYELIIRNIDKDIKGTEKFTAKDNTIPAIEKVEVLGENGIKVTTTEPVSNPRERNFLIDGKNVAMNIEQYGREIILTPYHKTEFSEKADTLTIKELVDYAGYRSIETDEEIEIVKNDVKPEVVDVISRGNQVEVIFDKDVYKPSVKAYANRSDVGNISYQAGRQTIYATGVAKVDTNRVVYTFKDELARRTDVTIVDVQNHSKVKMDPVVQEARIVLDYSEPEIIDQSVRRVSSTSVEIKLFFDKNVKGSFIDKDETKGFIAKDHFTLYEREVYPRNEVKYDVFESVKYDGAKRDVIVVVLEGLTEYDAKVNDLDYVLEVVNFTDTNSLNNKMYRDYVDFKLNKASTDFEIISVNPREVGRDTVEVEIKFAPNKAVDRVLAEDLTNYIFTLANDARRDVKQLDGDVIVEKNGNTVTLVLPEMELEDFKTLEVLEGLKDINGARISGRRVYDFESKELLYVGETVDKKRAADVTTGINALPAVIELTNKPAVVAARTAYDALSATQKELVTAETLLKLTDAETAIRALEADVTEEEEVNAVIALITALKEPYDIKLEDAAVVAEVKDAYNLLSVDQQALVTNVRKLNLVVDAIEVLVDGEDQILVDGAKGLVGVATFSSVGIADVNDEVTAEEAVKVVIDALELGEGVTYEITKVNFTAAVGGTTDGKYEFTVKLSKGNVNATTETLELVINK